MPKRIIIREDQLKDLVSTVTVPAIPAVQYPIDPTKVLIVKKFLDSAFKRGYRNEIAADGSTVAVAVISKLYPDGDVAEEMDMQTLKDLLMDKYQDIYSEEDRRDKFLGQVMKDWYNNKIGLYGSLSVNHL